MTSPSVDLSLYNIRIVDEDWKTFFGIDALPEPTAHPIILSELNPTPETPSDASIPGEVRSLLSKFRISPFSHGAPIAVSGPLGDSPLRAFLYTLLDYFQPHEWCKRYLAVDSLKLAYVFQGREAVTQMSTSGIDNYERTHIVAQLSTDFSPELEARLVSNAIAAYEHNRCIRDHAGFPKVERDEFGGMTLRGLAPTFYKITITEELSKAVAAEAGPPSGLHETVVRRCVPPTENLERYWSEGMWPLGVR